MRDSTHNTVVTVDILPKFAPTIVTDILTWNYRAFEPNAFDVVWCSPPCEQYSRAKTVGVRDLAGADALVAKCFEIIRYFSPRIWIVENPETGLLPRRIDGIAGVPLLWVDADYCAYGKPYRKRTRFWTNAPHIFHVRQCRGAGFCPSMTQNRHNGSCGNTTARYNAHGALTKWQKDAIPERLIDVLVTSIRGLLDDA
jgi:hypothetical protein